MGESLSVCLIPPFLMAFVGKSRCLLQTYLTVCKDVVMVGLGDLKFQTKLLQRTLAIMQTGTVYLIHWGTGLEPQVFKARPWCSSSCFIV